MAKAKTFTQEQLDKKVLTAQTKVTKTANRNLATAIAIAQVVVKIVKLVKEHKGKPEALAAKVTKVAEAGVKTAAKRGVTIG